MPEIYYDEPLSLDYNTVHKIAKPPLPYVPGNELRVVRHDPPPPAPPRWRRVDLEYEAAREREEVDALTRCLLHPPAEGKLIPQQSIRLQILDTIRAEDGHPAQLVTVRAISEDSSIVHDEVVAKFYDPLYYNHYSDDVNPFLCADRQYAWEAAAYSRLSGSQITEIPAYYGSYSLEIPVANKSRFVRLILIQKINGTPMDKLSPNDFSLSQRQAIMKGIVDVESQVYKNDVRHLDLHPRNVIVQNVSSARPKVVIIDFGKCYIGRSYDPEEEPEEEQAMLPGTYISPRVRWSVADEGNFRVRPFEEWITWNWNAWLKSEYKDDEVTDYMAAHWGPESTDIWPPGCE